MKTVSILSITSLATTLAFVTGLVFNVAVLPLFGAAAGALLLLTWAIDYRAPSDYAACATAAVRRRSALPLAA